MEGSITVEEDFASVVVIDDDCDSLDFLTTLLTRRGIRCAAFWQSQQALDYIREHPVLVVITDVFMPEIDGVQLISAIKECRPEASVIALSGYNQSYLRCMRVLGAIAGMSKPVDSKALVATVGRCLSPATPVEV
jgi:DNA-binding NtrC family response regulator